jgi:hypothetical protein
MSEKVKKSTAWLNVMGDGRIAMIVLRFRNVSRLRTSLVMGNRHGWWGRGRRKNAAAHKFKLGDKLLGEPGNPGGKYVESRKLLRRTCPNGGRMRPKRDLLFEM